MWHVCLPKNNFSVFLLFLSSLQQTVSRLHSRKRNREPLNPTPLFSSPLLPSVCLHILHFLFCRPRWSFPRTLPLLLRPTFFRLLSTKQEGLSGWVKVTCGQKNTDNVRTSPSCEPGQYIFLSCPWDTVTHCQSVTYSKIHYFNFLQQRLNYFSTVWKVWMLLLQCSTVGCFMLTTLSSSFVPPTHPSSWTRRSLRATADADLCKDVALRTKLWWKTLFAQVLHM